MKRSWLILILILLLAGIAYIWYQSPYEAHVRIHPLETLPPAMPFCLELDESLDLEILFSDENYRWPPEWKQDVQNLNQWKSFVEAKGIRWESFQWISWGQAGKNQIHPIIILQATDPLPEFIPYQPIPEGWQYQSRPYRQFTIHEFRLSTTAVIHIVRAGNIFLCSRSAFLIEECVQFIHEGKSKSLFASHKKQVKNQDHRKLWMHFSPSSFWNASPTLSWFKSLAQHPALNQKTFTFQPEIQEGGISLIALTVPPKLSQTYSLDNLLPSLPADVIFAENWLHTQNQDGFLDEWLKHQNGFAWKAYLPKIQSQGLEPIAGLQVIDSAHAMQWLSTISEKSSLPGGMGRLKDLKPSFHSLPEMEERDVFWMLLQQTLYLTNDLETLERLQFAINLKQNLAGLSIFQEHKEGRTKQVASFCWIRPKLLQRNMAHENGGLDPENSEISENMRWLVPDWIWLEETYDDPVWSVRLSFNFKNLTVRQEAPQILWERELVADPQRIITESNGNHFGIQSKNHQLYWFDKEGKNLWKVNLDAPILGQVKSLDYLQNQQNQWFFHTAHFAYMVDQMGKFISPYPIRLPCETNTDAHLIQYPDQINARYYIACDEKRIYGFEISGKPLPGWSPLEYQGRIANSISYLRGGEKDFLSFYTEEGHVYLLNRKGENRIPPVTLMTPITTGLSFVSPVSNRWHWSGLSMDGGYYLVGEDGSFEYITLYSDSVKHALSAVVDGQFRLYSLANEGIQWFSAEGLLQKTIRIQMETMDDLRFVSGDRFGILTIFDRKQGKIYAWDQDLIPLSGFPLNGNSPMEIQYSTDLRHFFLFQWVSPKRIRAIEWRPSTI